jgi:hypothetical protein
MSPTDSTPKNQFIKSTDNGSQRKENMKNSITSHQQEGII